MQPRHSTEEALTDGDERIHSAAAEDGADTLSDIEVEQFLDTLVDIAFAIAARGSSLTTDRQFYLENEAV